MILFALAGIFLFGCVSQQGPQFEQGRQASCSGKLNLANGCYQECLGSVRNIGNQAGTAQVTAILTSKDGTQTIRGYSEALYLNQNELKEWSAKVDTSCGVDYTFTTTLTRVG